MSANILGSLDRGLRAFRRDTAGTAAVAWAAMLPLVVGFLTLGVEVGLWFVQERLAQAAADSAAIAGALRQAEGESAETGAVEAAISNGADLAAGDQVIVRAPPTSGAHAGDGRAVEVIVDRAVEPLFARLFMDRVVVRTRAVAVAGAVNEFCVIGLDPAEAGAVTAGGQASLAMPGCGIGVNSHSASALSLSGSAAVTASAASAVGGIAKSNGASLNLSGGARTGAPPLADPYADVPMPDTSACDAQGYTAKGSVGLSPGTYCGGLAITAGADVTLAPGVYVIDGGNFTIDGGATLTGSDVTIVLTSSGGAAIGTVKINGGADVTLSAPTEGSYAGLLVYQDPAASSSGVNYLEGGSSTSFTGALYFPAQQLNFAGGNSLSGQCTQLIARKTAITGNSVIGNDCDDKMVRPIGRIRPALVE